MSVPPSKKDVRDELEKTCRYIHRKHTEGFWGTVEIKLEAGRVVYVTTKDGKKPKDLM
jgi:hypothetical protein